MSAKNLFKYRVTRDGEEIQIGTLTGPIIKVGALHSSHLKLPQPGVARMHAVIEINDGKWSVVDLGSAKGTTVNGEEVQKIQEIPEHGTLGFGPYLVEYELVEGRVAEDSVEHDDLDLSEGMPEGSLTEAQGGGENNHHLEMLKSLIVELSKLHPKAAAEASNIQQMWFMLDTERKRHFLRLIVDEIREARRQHDRFTKRKIAADLAIGVEGIEAIYDLTPEQALEKAHNILADAQMARSALELLSTLNMREKMKANLERVKATPGIDVEDEGRQADAFLKGHMLLEERLETIVTASSTLLTMAISRAGGGELNEKKREMLREQYAQLNATMKG